MTNTIAIVGLGYVGLPLAVAFGRQLKTIGFDLNEEKLISYRKGIDPSGEVNSASLGAAKLLEFTSDPAMLSAAEVIIVVVPTPIDDAHRPDLSPLEGACRTVGQYMENGVTVIFESTVYPGCTEEVRYQGKRSTLDLPKKQRGTTTGNHSAMNLGRFEPRINRCRHFDDVTVSCQSIEKTTEIAESTVNTHRHNLHRSQYHLTRASQVDCRVASEAKQILRPLLSSSLS